MQLNNYIVATTKEWHIKAYKESIIKLPGSWTLITSPNELSVDDIKKINPKYIFLPIGLGLLTNWKSCRNTLTKKTPQPLPPHLWLLKWYHRNLVLHHQGELLQLIVVYFCQSTVLYLVNKR